MNTKIEQFFEAYTNAPEELRTLIDSEKIGEHAEKLLTLIDKDATLKPALIILFSNFVLDVIDKEELQKDLLAIGIEDRETPMIISKIENIKRNPKSTVNDLPLPKNNETTIAQKVSIVHQTATQTTPSADTPVEVPVTTPTPTATPPAPKTTGTSTPAQMEPVRTMEKDMDRIHGYGAYRKLYPDVADTEPVTTPPHAAQPINQNTTQMPTAGYQALQSQVDDTIQSISQDEVLKGKLADTPKYTEGN